jgi:hypothetical protein
LLLLAVGAACDKEARQRASDAPELPVAALLSGVHAVVADVQSTAMAVVQRQHDLTDRHAAAHRAHRQRTARCGRASDERLTQHAQWVRLREAHQHRALVQLADVLAGVLHDDVLVSVELAHFF